MFYMDSIDLKTLIANRIFDARRAASAIAPVHGLWPAPTLADAYAVQRLNTERRTAAGGRTVGRKIGLTSEAVQQQLGVDAPDSGWLWADTGFRNAALANFMKGFGTLDHDVATVLAHVLIVGLASQGAHWILNRQNPLPAEALAPDNLGHASVQPVDVRREPL